MVQKTNGVTFTHYTGIMKANNLTVSINTPECAKNCFFCISKMTGEVTYDQELFWKNLPKARRLAQSSGVINVLITGKGEPLDNLDDLFEVISFFHESHFSVELQTNGIKLVNQPELVYLLQNEGLNVLAISVVDPYDLSWIRVALLQAEQLGLVTRVTIVLNDSWGNTSFDDILEYCKTNKVSQLTVRIPTIPAKCVDTEESKEVQEWIVNQNPEIQNSILTQMYAKTQNSDLIRILPFGPSVYDVQDIAVTTMFHCIQESNDHEDIRSLIYQADGHLYTAWDKKSSILF